MAMVGIKHDGSMWTRVGDGQAADMDPNDWYYGFTPSGGVYKYAKLVISSTNNPTKNFRLYDTRNGVGVFICEKENVFS